MIPKPDVLLARIVFAGTNAQVLQASVVVARSDRFRKRLAGQRRGRKLAQIGEGLEYDAVGVAFLRGQIEQHRIDTGVGQMGGDLRAHHAGT